MTTISGNLIRAQRYLHGARQQSIVFVGSSLTQVMEPYLNQPDVACLGLPGMGPVDGLNLIAGGGARPKLVMIEINLIHRIPSQELAEEALQPHLFWLHDQFSATRHEFQPSNLFLPWLEGTSRQRPASGLARPLPPGHRHQPSNDRNRADWVHDDVRIAFEQMPRILSSIERVQAPVGFYQLNEHPDITRAPALKKLRDLLSNHFHQEVLVELDEPYCTRDGAHMCEEDASAVAFKLLRQARARLARGS